MITFTFVLRSAPLVLKYHFPFLTAGFLSEAGSVLPALESGYLFLWKEPELDACFTHLSNREVAMSYSRQISHLRLPERYSSTSCCLNSSVYLRDFLRCFGSVIMSAPLCIYYRLYDLKKSVQLIVAYS